MYLLVHITKIYFDILLSSKLLNIIYILLLFAGANNPTLWIHFYKHSISINMYDTKRQLIDSVKREAINSCPGILPSGKSVYMLQ